MYRLGEPDYAASSVADLREQTGPLDLDEPGIVLEQRQRQRLAERHLLDHDPPGRIASAQPLGDQLAQVPVAAQAAVPLPNPALDAHPTARPRAAHHPAHVPRVPPRDAAQHDPGPAADLAVARVPPQLVDPR